MCTIINVFNTISVISWRSVLLMKETGVPGKKPPTCRRSLLPHHLQENLTGTVTRLTRRVPLVEQELLTLPKHRGSCYSIFSFICIFFRSLFVLLCFFFWTLCCLLFFDILIMITPLVSSSSS